jgi:multiple sugar transport system ATP-binding protein
VIDSGRIRQIGTPREIYEEPADTYVATFVGSPPMNLVPRGDDLIGFRPENLRLARDGATDAAAGVSFEMTSIRSEYLGSEKLVYGEVEGVRTVARMAANEPLPAPEGSSIALTVRNADLRIFDRETGSRRAPATADSVAGGPP